MKKALPRKKKPSKVEMGPLWDWTQGVTQSAIEKFLACREQFALGYVEGWTPTGFSTPLEFGSLIHFMLEQTGNGSPQEIARRVCEGYERARKESLSPNDYAAMQQTLVAAEALFPLYVKHSEADDSRRNYIQREHVFKCKHSFQNGPSAKDIILTGMRDGDYRNRQGGLGLFETKTKSSIDDASIQDGLRADLQTLLYLYSMQIEYQEVPVEILYNVIRRPQLRLGKKEDLQSYGGRISEDIQKRPEWYFRRFEVTVIPGDIEIFIKTTLDPVLRNMLQWWESVSADPFDRWKSPYHYRNLAALTTRYGKAPLYDLMIRGRTRQYFRRSSPFPELEGSIQFNL